MKHYEQVIQINLIGTMRVMSRAAWAMAQAEPLDADGCRGVVVNTASVAAFDGQIGQAAYASSKGGVAALTLPAARDLARNGIRVVTIAPGIFGTPMLRGLPERGAGEPGRRRCPSRSASATPTNTPAWSASSPRRAI